MTFLVGFNISVFRGRGQQLHHLGVIITATYLEDHANVHIMLANLGVLAKGCRLTKGWQNSTIRVQNQHTLDDDV